MSDRNPVVALREECNIKQCMPVWRALASRDPDGALAELHQPRPFGGVLGEINDLPIPSRDEMTARINRKLALDKAEVAPIRFMPGGQGPSW